MPSSMTHLLCAKIFAPDKSTAFFVGNISPDCIDIREFKDRTHFREIPEEDRPKALRSMASSLDIWGDEYLLGVVYHLFADYTWDIGPQKHHRQFYKGDSWFTDYRAEITKVGRQIYTRYAWSAPLWDDMASLDPSLYSGVKEYPTEEIRKFILRNREHAAIEREAPEFFTSHMVDSYAEKTAMEFGEFLKCL